MPAAPADGRVAVAANDNLFLTGFMATGKTAVGGLLARRLGRTFVDLDALVESAAGMSVAEIFARLGEPAFRSREREALEAVCRRSAQVVATGGGIVVDPQNRRSMRAAGVVVRLTAEPAAILARIGDAASRPLLAAAPDPLRRIHELLAERERAYAEADWTVDTTGEPPATVAGAIARWLAAGSPRGPKSEIG